MRKTFSKRESTKPIYDLYTITKIIHETVPAYRDNFFPNIQRILIKFNEINFGRKQPNFEKTNFTSVK